MAVNTNVNAIARAMNFVSTCPAADDEDTVPVAEPAVGTRAGISV